MGAPTPYPVAVAAVEREERVGTVRVQRRIRLAQGTVRVQRDHLFERWRATSGHGKNVRSHRIARLSRWVAFRRRRRIAWSECQDSYSDTQQDYDKHERKMISFSIYFSYLFFLFIF